MVQKYQQLAEKYNVAIPRYTSYPTMPYWDDKTFEPENWKRSLQVSFRESNSTSGISLYIHLPYCENLCTYCGCNTRITKNHQVEEPYIAAVLKEWQLYFALFDEKPVIRELHLGGGTPTFFSPQNLQKLLRGILSGAILHPEASLSFEAHPANTTTGHLQMLFKLGFRRLSLGIQDFDPKVQFIINRQQTYEQVLHVTERAREIGYTSINYDLIYGLPLQSIEGLINTMNIVAGLRPDRIAFYSYAHVPWLKPGQRRFTDDDLPDAQLKSKLHEVGRSLLTSYGYQEIGMDHFALPSDDLLAALHNGLLHRNFMGYTDQHTQLLIGLGVSSISDSWYAFAQNVKNVEDYIAITSNGEFPVFKGHLLNTDDLIIRKHILNIMCKGQTRWNHRNEPCAAVFEGIKRLEALAEDELITMDAWGLRVTPIGARFLRNICMCLDSRLWADQPGTQVFSMAV
jgi:oxygen-independent coproporphyrinogen-3 oxidase